MPYVCPVIATTMVRTGQKKRVIERGDAAQVTRMALARGLNEGRGWSRSYVSKCLREERRCKVLLELHDELVALRTPIKRAKK